MNEIFVVDKSMKKKKKRSDLKEGDKVVQKTPSADPEG